MRSFSDDKLPGRTDNSGVTVHQYYAHTPSRSRTHFAPTRNVSYLLFLVFGHLVQSEEGNPFQI